MCACLCLKPSIAVSINCFRAICIGTWKCTWLCSFLTKRDIFCEIEYTINTLIMVLMLEARSDVVAAHTTCASHETYWHLRQQNSLAMLFFNLSSLNSDEEITFWTSVLLQTFLHNVFKSNLLIHFLSYLLDFCSQSLHKVQGFFRFLSGES